MNKELMVKLKKQAKDWVHNNVVEGYNHEYHTAVDEAFVAAVLQDLMESLEDNYGPDDCLPIQEIQGFIEDRYVQ